MEGSIIRDKTNITFQITDYKHSVAVNFDGVVPDLFKEGKGVVAQGQISDGGRFTASEVLAKHDENYMPPEAQHALDEAAAAKAAQSIKTEQ